MSNTPPADVAEAAAKVEAWLQSTAAAQQSPARVTDSEFEKMTAKQRLDYCRTHDQTPFKPNPSPR